MSKPLPPAIQADVDAGRKAYLTTDWARHFAGFDMGHGPSWGVERQSCGCQIRTSSDGVVDQLWCAKHSKQTR